MSIRTETIVFDDRLADKLPFQLGRIKPLRDWILSQDHQIRTDLAANVFSEMSNQSCRRLRLLSNDGYIRIHDFALNIHRFEGLIGHVRTRFRGKVYRDHLDHMLRTSMIASYLAGRIGIHRKEWLSSRQRLRLVIAALFHDIGYHVQEAGKIISDIATAIGEGYSLVSFGEARGKVRAPARLIVQLSNSSGVETEIIEENLEKEEPNHAVISALEFLKCCRQIGEESLRIASAILLHAPEINLDISYSSQPLATLLALADEIQDWGRPIVHPDGTQSITLNDLQIWRGKHSESNQLIAFQFQYVGNEFPLISVVQSKNMNLRRLRIPFNIELRFPLKPSQTGSIESFARPSENLVKLEKRAKNYPWKVYPNSTATASLSDEQMMERTGIKAKSILIAARTALSGNLKKSSDDSAFHQWTLWQQGKSFDFIVTKKMPVLLDLVSHSGKIKLRITFADLTGLESFFGNLIHLNNPQESVRIPAVLKPLPITLSLHHGSQAEVFWFKPVSAAPVPISTRRMMREFGR